jgi:hypothetical protein
MPKKYPSHQRDRAIRMVLERLDDYPLAVGCCAGHGTGGSERPAGIPSARAAARLVFATFRGWVRCWDTPGYRRRCSTRRLHVDELTAAGCYRVYTDHASGTLDRRPELDAVLAQLRPGDSLVVCRLDRLGRSLRHLIDTVTSLDERQVGFRPLREDIDTTTRGRAAVFHLFGALAQCEREIIRDRTVAGLAAARAAYC